MLKTHRNSTNVKQDTAFPQSAHNQYSCQLFSLPDIVEKLSLFEIIWQSRQRAKRILKRRYYFLCKFLADWKNSLSSGVKETAGISSPPLQPGDSVRVKSWLEIRQTLNNWHQLNGCSFMEEMWPYCGTRQTVLKRVEKFLDERDYRVKKCKGIVILDGVMCQGTKDFGACDRSCFFFWREEWLEKMND